MSGRCGLSRRWCGDELKISTVGQVTESSIRHYIISIQERGKYSFYSGTEQKALYKPERRRDYRKPVSPTTINNYLRNLRAFFGWLAEENYISRNPMKKVKFLKVQRKAKDYLTDDEFKKLVNSWINHIFQSTVIIQ